MRQKAITSIGLAFIIFGIICNQWILTALFSSGGVLHLSSKILILIFEFLLISIGLIIVLQRVSLSRKFFLFSLSVGIGSCLLLFLDRFTDLSTLVVFLSKAGLSIGILGTLTIGSSLWLLGEDRSDDFCKNILVLLTTLIVLLIVCEFGVRFIFRDITTTSDNQSYFARRWNKENVRLNSLRFREREFDLYKEVGVYRIAVIGDSFTFGQGIPEADRFTNLLEKRLNSKKPSHQVLNFGKCGTETVHHLTTLKDVVIKTDPDFVLLQWYINDFEGYNKGARPKRLPLLPSRFLTTRLQRVSALYFLVNHQWVSLQKSLGLSQSYVEYMNQRFSDPKSADSLCAQETLRDFINECKSRRIDLGIVLFPDPHHDLGTAYPYTFLHNRVLELCDEALITCLDLRNSFGKFPEKTTLWVNRLDAHPNSLANQIAADRIMELFAKIWLSGVPIK